MILLKPINGLFSCIYSKKHESVFPNFCLQTLPCNCHVSQRLYISLYLQIHHSIIVTILIVIFSIGYNIAYLLLLLLLLLLNNYYLQYYYYYFDCEYYLVLQNPS